MFANACVCMHVYVSAFACGEEGRYRQQWTDRPLKKFVEMHRSVDSSSFGKTEAGMKVRNYFLTKWIRSYSSPHNLITELHISDRDDALDELV